MDNTHSPTTFLSLPRELRQQILLCTYDDQEQCRLPPPGVQCFYHDALVNWYSQQRHVIAWVKILRQVYEEIEEDVLDFVGNRWDAALEKNWKEICERYRNEMRDYGTGEMGIMRSQMFGGPLDYTDGL